MHHCAARQVFLAPFSGYRGTTQAQGLRQHGFHVLAQHAASHFPLRCDTNQNSATIGVGEGDQCLGQSLNLRVRQKRGSLIRSTRQQIGYVSSHRPYVL